jgi:hypothetical protein
MTDVWGSEKYEEVGIYDCLGGKFGSKRVVIVLVVVMVVRLSSFRDGSGKLGSR